VVLRPGGKRLKTMEAEYSVTSRREKIGRRSSLSSFVGPVSSWDPCGDVAVELLARVRRRRRLPHGVPPLLRTSAAIDADGILTRRRPPAVSSGP
jgi:hypothetical protein